MRLQRATLDGFFGGAPTVEPRSRTVFIPAFSHEFRLSKTEFAFGIKIGQFQFFPQPVNHVVHLQFKQQANLTLLAAAFAFFLCIQRAPCGRAKHITGLALTLTGATTQGYFSLRSLDAQITITRETLTLRQQYEDLVRQRVAGGIASDLDLNLAQGAKADAAVQLQDLVRLRELVEHQLGVLTGRLDLTVPAGDLRNLPVPPSPPPGLPSTLLTRRPDIRQAEQNLIATNAQIGIAKADLFPLLSLTGSLGSQSSALATLLSSPAGIWSVGAAVAIPLFDSGRRDARVDAAAAREQQALGSYQKAVEAAFREVADALTNLQQSAASEQDLSRRLAAARNALGLSRMRYEAGYSGYLEFLDAQRTENDAELAVLRNRQASLSAHVDLLKAIGGGWTAGDVAAGAKKH